MSKLGKALLGTAAIGGLGGTIVLGILYSSSSASYGNLKNDCEKKLKDIEDKLTLATQEKDEANKAKEIAIKDKEQAEKERDEAKADLSKFSETEVNLAPCQATESNIDYKSLADSMTERLQELQLIVDSVTKNGDDAQQEMLNLQQNYQDASRQIYVWKDKFQKTEDELLKLKVEHEKLKAEGRLASEHQISMMADMSKQYEELQIKYAELQQKWDTYTCHDKPNAEWTPAGEYHEQCFNRIPGTHVNGGINTEDRSVYQRVKEVFKSILS